MKRILAVLLTMVMVLSMAGCNSATNVEGTHEHTTGDITEDRESTESNSTDSVTETDESSTENTANNSTESDENNSTVADENNSTESDENNSTEKNDTTKEDVTSEPTTNVPTTSTPVVKPTQPSTQAPTHAPTQAPTQAPTEAPTKKPTEAPTEEPTEAPTQRPTEAPTTHAPTQAPTEEPTEATTEAPTVSNCEHLWQTTDEYVAPDCYNDGYFLEKCTACGTTRRQTLEGGEHSWKEWYITKQPTETKDGERKRDCYFCSASDVEVLEKLSTHTHNYEAAYEKNPTCTSTGTMRYSCYCGSTYTEEVPMSNHFWQGDDTVPPTCLEQGYTYYHCFDCGETKIDNYTDALGHEYAEKVWPPSCYEEGYTLHYCIHGNCFEQYKTGPYVPACHQWGEWEIVSEPIFEFGQKIDGLKVRYCTACPESEKEVIPYE